MISLFLGLHTANLLLLASVFTLGWLAIGGDGKPTEWFSYHIALAIAAGLMTLAAHVGTYMYFMATARWLEAASHKLGASVERWAQPALRNKSRVFALMMASIGAMMLTMFAGAAADPTVRPWWGGEVHLLLAMLTMVINGACAVVQGRLVLRQGGLMDQALAQLGGASGTGSQAVRTSA